MRDTNIITASGYNVLFLGKVDSSGMRFWMTENLRPIDVGQAGMGIDVTKYAQVLPPGVSELTNYGYCSAQCTKDFPEDGVKIIGGLLHTHLAGMYMVCVDEQLRYTVD